MRALSLRGALQWSELTRSLVTLYGQSADHLDPDVRAHLLDTIEQAQVIAINHLHRAIVADPPDAA